MPICESPRNFLYPYPLTILNPGVVRVSLPARISTLEHPPFPSTTSSSTPPPPAPLILFPKQLQRERDNASVKEARRIWVQGLEGDRAAAAAAAAASAAAAVAVINATAAAAAAAADDDAENPSSAAAATGGGGVLSFLDPPTSEAEASAAAAITERYRLLGEEADARAARARWKRQRSARAVAARASLKVLYAEESHLWRGMAAKKAVAAAAGHGTPGNGVVVDGSAQHAPAVIEATPAASPSSSSNGGGGDGGQNGRVAEEAFAEGEDKAAGDSDSDGGGMEVEVAEAVETTLQEDNPVAPEPPGKHKHPEAVNFSPVTIVDEPGGKSVHVSATLGGPVDEAPRVKFSHVNILQDPGGKSCGVSGALGAGIDGSISGGDDAAATAGSLPGRSGLRRIVQEPGGNSSAVSRIMSHDARRAADRVSTVGTGAVDSTGDDPLPRASIQGSGDNSVGLSLPAEEEEEEEEVTVAAAGVSTGGHGRRRSNLQDVPSSGGSPDHRVAAAAERKESREGAAAARNGRSFFPDSKEKEHVRGRAMDTHTSPPLEVIVRRCVREPVLAQCRAVDSAALAFLVRDAGVAEHLASLRTFLLGLTSDFLHDFTLRLLDGLYDGG